jgi:tetratricopeptide (TPR) repeat protein
MLKYFIRTDQLGEVLPLQTYFMSDPKRRKITVPTLAELGGYLLDKRFEETEGVPEEYVDQIEGIRDVLTRAIQEDRTWPESYYHLARYSSRYGLGDEERRNLEDAIRAFEAATEETPKRTAYHIDARRRYGEVLINAREFFPAGEELTRGVRLYENARSRGLIKNSRPEFGRLYADLGDLEFFVGSGNMDRALQYYEEAERNDWSPPEIQYRMGAAHYQNGAYEEALRRFFALSSVMPNNKRLLYALGNTAYLRGDYFAAQGYYNRLMDLLDSERVRFPDITPDDSRPEEQDLAERIMVADNNLGVTLEALTRVSGDTSYRTRALYLFSESIRAWDVLTRDPESMTRMRPIRELYSPGINLAYLNAQNLLHASPSYEQQIFMRIDRDCLEPSDWEAMVPRDYRLSDQLPMDVE